MIDWDLNTGKIKRSFDGSGGQISAIEIRPSSSLPVPEASGETVVASSTFSTDSIDKPRTNGIFDTGLDGDDKANTQGGENGIVNDAGSPADSLFGGNDADSLFGDNEDGEAGAPSGGNFVDDDDDEFSRAIANGIQEQENEDAEGDVNMIDGSEAPNVPLVNGDADTKPALSDRPKETQSPAEETALSGLADGLPHADELPPNSSAEHNSVPTPIDAASTADSTFLAASFDGSLRVWDKRQSAPIAKIPPRNVPPWCMNACWSPDGNYIYAGRRNGTVEEFSLHKGLRGVERSLKLPDGSGPVSAVRAMPNGRHLIW